MSRPVNPLMVRDCYAQARAICRILGCLQDDLGDIAASSDNPEFEAMADMVEQIDRQIETMKDRLANISYGVPTVR